MGTTNGIQRPFPFTHVLRLRIAHVWFTLSILVLYLGAEIQEICLFYCWINGTLPRGKCHFSANTAEFIRVIYAPPGYVYIYTTQSMTV